MLRTRRNRSGLPLLRPCDCGVVHLIDDNDELGDSGRLDELSVLSGLTPLVESGLELSLSSRDDLRDGKWSLATDEESSRARNRSLGARRKQKNVATHKKSNIGLSGSADHAGDVGLVTGSIEDSVSTGGGLEVGSSDLDGLSLQSEEKDGTRRSARIERPEWERKVRTLARS